MPFPSATAMFVLVSLTLCLLLPAALSWDPEPACSTTYSDDHQNSYEGIDRKDGFTGVDSVLLLLYSSPVVVWCAAPDRHDSDHLVSAIQHCYPRLRAYFNGSNDRQLQLNLTIPLVSHAWRDNGSSTTWHYQVAFKVPHSVGWNAPHPNDSSLSIDSLGFDRWTAVGLQFGGTGTKLTDKTAAAALQQLNDTVTQQLGISRVSNWHKAIEVNDPLMLDTNYHWNTAVHWLPLGEQESAASSKAAAAAGDVKAE